MLKAMLRLVERIFIGFIFPPLKMLYIFNSLLMLGKVMLVLWSVEVSNSLGFNIMIKGIKFNLLLKVTLKFKLIDYKLVIITFQYMVTKAHNTQSV